MHLQLLWLLVILCTIIQCNQASILDYDNLRDPLEFVWGQRDPLLNQPNKACIITVASERLEGVCSTNFNCAYNRGTSGQNSTCGLFSTCCVYTGSCGETTSAKVSYFKHNNIIQPGLCTNTIRVINRNICQIRLDFLRLNLERPSDLGTCDVEHFYVNTGNTFIKFCGPNNNQHIYVQMENVGTRLRHLDLSILRQSINDWTIKVTQLHCPATNVFNLRNQLPAIVRDFQLLAPQGCTQYYREATGTFRNFGYFQGGHYSEPLKYTICFRRPLASSECIRFTTNSDFALGADDFLYVPRLIANGTTPPTNGEVTRFEHSSFISATPGPYYIYFESVAPTTVPAQLPVGFEINYSTLTSRCTP